MCKHLSSEVVCIVFTYELVVMICCDSFVRIQKVISAGRLSLVGGCINKDRSSVQELELGKVHVNQSIDH